MEIVKDAEHDADAERAGAEHAPDEHGKPGKPSRGGAAPPAAKKNDRRQMAIIALSFVGVVIAYMTYRSRSAKANAAATALPSSPYLDAAAQQAAAGSGGFVAGTGASDGLTSLLDNLSGEIAAMQSTQQAQLTTLPDAIAKAIKGTTPAPVTNSAPHFIYGSAAHGLRYIKNLANGFIYQINPNGSQYHLSASQYAELGNPKYTTYGSAPRPKPKPKPKPPPKKK